MYLTCVCGTSLSDIGQPNNVEHLLLSGYALERLQDLADDEVEKAGRIDMWPKHWDASGATEVWRCWQCRRLMFNVRGPREEIVVYHFERKGI